MEAKETIGRREVVVMLVRNDKEETLFTKRAPSRKFLPGVWALPSGHIDKGEDFSTATIREAKEELDVDVREVRLVEIIDEPSGDSNVKVNLVEIAFESYSGIPSVNTDEFKTIAWMRIEDFYNRFKDEEIGSTLRHLRSKFQKKN